MKYIKCGHNFGFVKINDSFKGSVSLNLDFEKLEDKDNYKDIAKDGYSV